MEQRGRKSSAELSVITPERPRLAPPADLPHAAAAVWRAVVASVPSDRFLAGDIPLLREYCITAGVLLPEINKQISDEAGDMKNLTYRTMLTKELMSLAAKLRLCVSARTRGDLASMRKGNNSTLPDWAGFFHERN